MNTRKALGKHVVNAQEIFYCYILICYSAILNSVLNQPILGSVFLTILEASRRQGLCPFTYLPPFSQCGANTGLLINTH